MIQYKINPKVEAKEVAALFSASGINRPSDDLERIEKMIKHASISIGAYEGDKLVGYARGLSDFCYACYLSDLAVDQNYQKMGIGKELLEQMKNELSDEVTIVLISAPSAVDFYNRIGLENSDRAFIIPRKK